MVTCTTRDGGPNLSWFGCVPQSCCCRDAANKVVIVLECKVVESEVEGCAHEAAAVTLGLVDHVLCKHER
jgi:hypothetical protein